MTPLKKMNKQYLWHFLDGSISSDVISDKGRITRFKEVFCISDSEDNARVKSKLDSEYTLIEVKELGEDWN